MIVFFINLTKTTWLNWSKRLKLTLYSINKVLKTNNYTANIIHVLLVHWMFTYSLSTTQRYSVRIETWRVCFFQSILPNFFNQIRVCYFIVKPITPNDNKIMSWADFKLFDFRLWRNHVWISTKFFNFCMSIPNCSWDA